MSELTAENVIPKVSAGVITLPMLEAFARVSGDPNRIHLDVEVARAMGLPNVIAHGMFIASLLHSRAEGLRENHPELRDREVLRTETRFKSMTLLGDEVFTEGHLEIADEARIILEILAKNQRGEVVVQSRLTLSTVRSTL